MSNSYYIVLRTYHKFFLILGLVDDKEAPEQAAIRELEEETGFKSDRVIELTPLLANDPGLFATECTSTLQLNKSWFLHRDDNSEHETRRPWCFLP